MIIVFIFGDVLGYCTQNCKEKDNNPNFFWGCQVCDLVSTFSHSGFTFIYLTVYKPGHNHTEAVFICTCVCIYKFCISEYLFLSYKSSFFLPFLCKAHTVFLDYSHLFSHLLKFVSLFSCNYVHQINNFIYFLVFFSLWGIFILVIYS